MTVLRHAPWLRTLCTHTGWRRRRRVGGAQRSAQWRVFHHQCRARPCHPLCSHAPGMPSALTTTMRIHHACTRAHVLVQVLVGADFRRDLLFYLGAVILVFATVIDGRLFLWESLAMFGFYLVYLVVTVRRSRDQAPLEAPHPVAAIHHEIPRALPMPPLGRHSSLMMMIMAQIGNIPTSNSMQYHVTVHSTPPQRKAVYCIRRCSTTTRAAPSPSTARRPRHPPATPASPARSARPWWKSSTRCSAPRLQQSGLWWCC